MHSGETRWAARGLVGIVTLVADNISVERGGRLILDNLAFKVAPGEILLLTGPNGAGKTTLIRALGGLMPLVAGRIVFESATQDRTLAERAHYVGHANALKASLTAFENLTFWADFLDGDRARVEDALDALRLGPLADVPAGYLSAGQKRRLGLARLLVADRPVWLLDEPTVSLDVASTERLAELMKKQVAGGGIVIAATHLNLGVEGARELRLGRPQSVAA